MRNRAIISEKGLHLLKAFEGYRPDATMLPNGIWVIGHGHTVSAREGASVNFDEAGSLLRWDVSKLAPKVKDCIFAPVTQPQMDGLLSLAFNIGMENFANSDVVHFLNKGNVIRAASAFDLWRKAKLGGRIMVVDALVRRRTAEKALFLDVDGAVVAVPSARLRPLDDREQIEPVIIPKANAETPPPPSEAVEVSIDLDTSSALGSLLGPNKTTEDGTPFSFDPATKTTAAELPGFIYSDDDQSQAEPLAEETPAEPEISNVSDIIPNGDKLVPIGDVFEAKAKTVEPLRVVAEKISGRLSEISPELVDEQQPILDQAPKPPVEDEAQENTLDTAEQSEAWSDDLPSEARLGDFPYDEDAELPPLPENGKLSPEELFSEKSSNKEEPFEPLQRRNTGMFILMGIIGLILSVGGVFEIRKSGGVIVDMLDWIMGPGLAGLGILLVLVAAYFLVRKMGRSG
ncbi:hypothetical protein MNBD_ALPHA06-853 [hydrothermal vent metagenome]|uniref:Lysozyme n=1 Tax=hydrothermal vent metagenome TaxID=652676 RepID=A0A3B0R8Q5_9ZZZZ